MIIDAHAHIYDRMRGSIGSGPIEPLRWGKVRLGDGQVTRILPPVADEISFSPGVLLEYMDDADVDRAVLLQGSFYGEMNDYVQQAVRRWPQRFVGAAFLDLWLPDAQAQFHHLVDKLEYRILKFELSEATGLSGLHPDLTLDDHQVEWFWQEADCRDLVVTLDLGAVGGRAYQTAALRKILDKHPDLKVVIAHLAQPPLGTPHDQQLDAMWQEQLLLGQRPSVWFDLASLPNYAGQEDYPYPSACRAIGRAVELIGANKLLWGTDIPGLLPRANYLELRSYLTHCDFLCPADLAKILGDNAARVYWSASAEAGSLRGHKPHL